MPLLTEQSSKVVCFFAADFEPRIDFQAKLPAVGASIERSLGKVVWQASANKMTIRSEEKPVIAIIDHKRIAMQTLGFTTWADAVSAYGDLLRNAMDSYGVTSLTRFGFKTKANLSIGLTNEELRRLLFGSFLPKQASFPKAFGVVEDPLVQLEGVVEGYGYVLVVTALTEEQSKVDIASFPNAQIFVNDIGAPRPEITELRSSVGHGFLVDIDLFKKDVEVGELRLFLGKTLELATAMTESAVRFLKALDQDHH